MTDATKKEVLGLLDRGTLKIVLQEDVTSDSNVLPGRFVLSIKSDNDGFIKWKARFFISGYRDKLKKLMFHASQTLQPLSILPLLTLAAINCFYVWTYDVRQEYLHSDHPSLALYSLATLHFSSNYSWTMSTVPKDSIRPVKIWRPLTQDPRRPSPRWTRNEINFFTPLALHTHLSTYRKALWYLGILCRRHNSRWKSFIQAHLTGNTFKPQHGRRRGPSSQFYRLLTIVLQPHPTSL